MVYKDFNLVYLKDLWQETTHDKCNSNIGNIGQVKIVSKNDIMDQYNPDNEFYLKFVDNNLKTFKYKITEAEYLDDVLSVTVEELSYPIVIKVGETFDESTSTSELIEYTNVNIADVFPDNAIDLTGFAFTYIGLVPETIKVEGNTYIDIDTDDVPPTIYLYTPTGFTTVQKIVKNPITDEYFVYFSDKGLIRFYHSV